MQQPGMPAEKLGRKEVVDGPGDAVMPPPDASAAALKNAAAPKLTTAYYVFGADVHSGYSMRSASAGSFAAYLIGGETKTRP